MTKQPGNFKYGAEISAKNKTKIQQAHDAMCEMGAECKQAEPDQPDTADEEKTLVAFGGELKSLGRSDDGGLHVGGYLVKYGDPTQTDLSPQRDYFTKDTDFGPATESDVYYNHRAPIKGRRGEEIVVKRKFGTGHLTRDDVGVFIDAVTYNRDIYDEVINETVTKTLDKHGWSSGTASHLVDRVEQKNGSNWISKWPLGLDASLTPTPAEPRNSAVPLKSLFGTQSLAGRPASDGASVTVTEEEKKQAAILKTRFL